MKYELSASLMCADFSRLGDQLAELRAGGVTRLHLDFADGHFAPNLILGTEVFAMLGRDSGFLVESHLMLQDPSPLLSLFLPGSDAVILHAESSGDLPDALARIHSAGRKAGIALIPGSPASLLVPFLDVIDSALVLSVRPGFAGGEFLPASIEAVRQVHMAAAEARVGLDIQADGSINTQTLPLLLNAGANIFVGGSSGLFLDGDLAGHARALLDLMPKD